MLNVILRDLIVREATVCGKIEKKQKKMQQPQRFPNQGPPMRPYQPGYSPGPPRPGGYPGPQMVPGGPPQRMGMPGQHGGMPPHPYAAMRQGMSPGMPPPHGPPGLQTPMDRKRPPPDPRAAQHMKAKKKKKVADKILPQRQKRKLRIFISNTFYPAKAEGEDGEETGASWELRVEGRLLEDAASAKLSEASKVKRKFSSFFKSLVIELDKDLYGPDNHLVEPPQFKLDQRLARILGVHTQTRPVIINSLWQYIKTHKLQDPHEREYINCDKFMEQVKRVEGPDARKTACYDIDVEVDDTLKQQMNSFLLSTQSQQEISALDSKIHETVETINQLKTNREFFLSFAKDPQVFINNWLISQTRDLKTMTDVVGNPEEERRADYYYQPWTQEAVCRYFYNKVQQRRIELEQALAIRNN
ncbi:hypothetical protein KUTeg_008295 [Tegillarca granosa]|uniref:DM2 domain-containing protein n=1 Tax=Tegillarca granosa TaxID=220873 RepID=A0ABQ9F8S1_TEGGR|nr:hypothetical protein KUTeg_008295 [Tegillarca granosa]